MSFCIAICCRCCPILGAAASVTSGGVHFGGISELCDELGWSWECCVKLEDEVDVVLVVGHCSCWLCFLLSLFPSSTVLCCMFSLSTIWALVLLYRGHGTKFCTVILLSTILACDFLSTLVCFMILSTTFPTGVSVLPLGLWWGLCVQGVSYTCDLKQWYPKLWGGGVPFDSQ